MLSFEPWKFFCNNNSKAVTAIAAVLGSEKEEKD
jgi:hypothetical protein